MDKMVKLRRYQVEAVKRIIKEEKILVADDMGFGKTAIAIACRTGLENEYNKDLKTIISCPSSVMPHWENEIKTWYKKGKDTKISKIGTTTYDLDIENARDADFVLIGYSTLSKYGNQERKINLLNSLGFKNGILDEGHNVKNPDANRTRFVKGLYDPIRFLTITTGTPLPNSIVDIYMQLNLLEKIEDKLENKETFKINLDNKNAAKNILRSFYSMFKQNPDFVKNILDEKMIRRTVDEGYIKGFPKIHERTLDVFLQGEHKDVYMQLYENDNFEPGEKLTQLRNAALDPNLVLPKFLDDKFVNRIGRMKSSIYDSLDNLLEEIVDNNGKALVFSDLRVGVTAKLKEKYKEYGALVTDGVNSDLGIREDIRQKFQKDPDSKILFSTNVMGEGVDLTAATDVIHLPPLPYTPTIIDQRNRRTQRIGEIIKKYINAHTLIPKIDLVHTVTEGISELLKDKRRIVDYILDHPNKITKQDLDEIKNGPREKSRHLKPCLNPKEVIKKHISTLKAYGSKNISEFYKQNPETAENFANLYARCWEGNYGGNTANLIREVIDGLKEKVDLEKKLDIASGPFSLSRTINESIMNIDINPYMFKAGKILEEEGIIVKGNEFVNGSFINMPFDSNSFDLTVCSLALHMAKFNFDEGKRIVDERQQAFREMNRVIKKDGYGLITLPKNLILETDLERLYDGLTHLGFEVLPFSGFYKGPKGTRYKGYITGIKKIKEASNKKLPKDTFEWEVDRDIIRNRKRSSSRKRKDSVPKIKETKKEIVSEFFNTRTKKSLGELVREGKN